MEFSIDKKSALIGLLIGAILMFSFLQFNSSQISKDKATQIVKENFELANPGSSITGFTVVEESGLYKVIFRISGILTEAYVTKDGELIIPSVVQTEESETQFQAQKNFFSCLKEKGFKMYGLSDTNSTILQIQIFQSSPYLLDIYQECSGEMMQICLDKGIERVPAFEFNSTIHEGIKTIEEIEKLTGCKFE